MNRTEILQAAQKIVCGQREQDYGSPEDNFGAIAALWGTYLGIDINADEVAVMMILFKIGRLSTGYCRVCCLRR